MYNYPVISVLYVDDETGLLEIGRLFLERTGLFSVDTVDSAPEALRIIAEKRYDAIISDYQMPEMDGIDLLKRVRASGSTIPFIIFTGRGREEIVIQALNEGADFYLQKGGEPVSQFAELAHKVQMAVQQRRAEASIRDHERREADIINFLPDATFAIDTSGVVIAWNRAIEEMTGVPAVEMLGKGDHEYANPFYGQRRPILIDLISESDEVIAKKYSHVIREKDILIAETTLPHPKGKSAILMGKASPLFNRQGEIIGAIESIRDITKIREAEESLRESEQKYRTVFETTGTATVMIEDDATISLANSEFERLSGYRKDEIEYKKKWTEFVVGEDLDRMLAQHRLRRQDRLSALTHYEFRFMPRSKEIRDIYLTIDVIPGTGKSVASLLDITTRKQAESEVRAAYEQLTATEEELRRQYRDLAEKEQKLRQSEARYRNVVEVQTELISRFLPDGTHVFVNEAYCRYFGKSREEIIGHIFIPDIPGEDRGAVKIHFASLTPSQPVRSIEHRILMPDGEVRWQRWNDQAIFNEKGTITEFQSVGRDITDRMEAEEALRESEEQYRSLVETTGTGYVILDKDGRVIMANQEYVRLTGRSTLAEIAGRAVTEWTAPYDCERNAMEVRQCFRKGQVRGLEIDYQKPDGTIQPIEINASVIQSDSGQIILTLCRDISRRRQVEDELRRANRKLKLLSSITWHDINNQITLLTGFLRILEKKQTDPSLSEYFQKISTTAGRISAMIHFTREYERIGVHEPVWQDIHTIVRKASEESPLGKVIVKNDLPSGTEVFADPLIVKVFYNLMDNAVRHGGRITTIRFTVQESGNDHTIVCEDDGEGIPAGEKKRIFDRGYGKNTGMGLVLAREILAITGITICETGDPDTGARFEITVPKEVYRVVDIQQKIIPE